MDNTTRQHHNKCQPDQNAEEHPQNEGPIGLKNLISIGLVLVKCVRKTDRSFGGIIINTYISCLLMSTATQYVGSTLFFNSNGSHSFHLYVSGCLSVALLSFLRLLYLTNCNDILVLCLMYDSFLISIHCYELEDCEPEQTICAYL